MPRREARFIKNGKYKKIRICLMCSREIPLLRGRSNYCSERCKWSDPFYKNRNWDKSPIAKARAAKRNLKWAKDRPIEELERWYVLTSMSVEDREKWLEITQAR